MKILNFGSLNIDLVYSLNHIMRPGETISSLRMERFCGGKGLNQSIALARAGGEVYHAGCVGQDGGLLIEMLKSNGVNIDYIKMIDVPSGNAIIQVDKNGQNSIILFGGANNMITEDYINEVLSCFSKGDLIVLQNEINVLGLIIDKAFDKGLQIVLNPSPMNSAVFNAKLNKVSYFILNEIEGKDITEKSEWQDIIEKIKVLYPKAKIVLTLGKNGVVYYDGYNIYEHGTYKVEVVDTTAAGDTFLGYFIALISDNAPDEVLRLSSIASSLAVSVKGASNSIPTLSDVRNAKLD